MILKQLYGYSDFNLPKELLNLLANYQYVFNPSYVFHSNVNYLAVRVFSGHMDNIEGIVFTWGELNDINILNLSLFLKEKLDVKKVADPKLFVMNSHVYCTCNSGDGQVDDFNKLFLIRLSSNKVFSYHICNYDKRQKTEKNWAFYFIDEQIYALYSLNPLTILIAKPNSLDTLEFEECFSDFNQNYKNLSIGTPIIKEGKELIFMAHKKYYNSNKRLYVGRICRLSLAYTPKLVVNNKMFVHSFKSMLGEKFKFNKNLISCTYFSSFFKENDNLILGYGVNDLSWQIKKLKYSKLCQ